MQASMKMDEEMKAKEIMEVLEDDDEFEDFGQEDWTGQMEDKEDAELWKNEWVGDEPDDDFTKALKKQLTKP